MRPYPAFTQPAPPPPRATPPGLPVASAAAHKHPIAHEALSLFLKFYLQEVQSLPPPLLATSPGELASYLRPAPGPSISHVFLLSLASSSQPPSQPLRGEGQGSISS